MESYYLFSKVITKVPQILFLLFRQAVKTSFVEIFLIRLRSVSTSVRDFAVRMKHRTSNAFFSEPKMLQGISQAKSPLTIWQIVWHPLLIQSLLNDGMNRTEVHPHLHAYVLYRESPVCTVALVNFIQPSVCDDEVTLTRSRIIFRRFPPHPEMLLPVLHTRQ